MAGLKKFKRKMKKVGRGIKTGYRKTRNVPHFVSRMKRGKKGALAQLAWAAGDKALRSTSQGQHALAGIARVRQKHREVRGAVKTAAGKPPARRRRHLFDNRTAASRLRAI